MHPGAGRLLVATRRVPYPHTDDGVGLHRVFHQPRSHAIAALVHGSEYERIAGVGCSDATIRRRLKEWAALGLSEQMHTLALRVYDRMLGLELNDLALDGCIARKGIPAPVQAGARRVVEQTHQWMNGYGKLRRCTEKRAAVVDFYLFLAAALVVLRQLIQRARLRYRWPSRPTTRRLK
jgi:hypothetical protein